METDSKYTVRDGVILYKGRVWVGSNAAMKQQILQATHSSATGGHSGVQATYAQLR